jgi:long-chain acyl-CoA synthetase
MTASKNPEKLQEHARELDEWRESTSTLVDMFFKTANKFSSRPANVFYKDGDWKTVTYEQWKEISEGITAALISHGVKKGDNVCIIAPTAPEWCWADIGIALAGGCTVSIFPTLSAEEIAFILSHSEVTYVFAGNNELMSKVMEIGGSIKNVKGYICFDNSFSGNGKTTWNLSSFREEGKAFIANNPNALKERTGRIKETDPVTMIYTSGTTGKLKAACFTHGDWIGGLWRSIKGQLDGGFWWDENDVYGSIMPLAHVMERTYGYYTMIARGCCIAIGRGPLTVMEDFQAFRPTCTVVVPRMLDRVIKGVAAKFSATPEGEKAWDWAMAVAGRVVDARTRPNGTIDMSVDHLDELTGQLREEYLKAMEIVFAKVHGALGGRMRMLASGGGALLPELHRPWTGMGFFVPNGYGLTETQCGLAVGQANNIRISWNAVMNPGQEYRIEPDGELLVKGKGIITEYYRDADATASGFTADGFFRTGDIVEIDNNGIIRVIDRKKGIIVMDTGKNVAAAKVESLVLADLRLNR